MNTLFSALWNCYIRPDGRLPCPAVDAKAIVTRVRPAPAARRCCLLALFLGWPLVAPGQAMPQDNWYVAEYWDFSKPEYAILSSPKCLAIGPNGDIWVTTGASRKIVRLSPAGQVLTSFNYVGNYDAIDIAVSSNRVFFATGAGSGAVWTSSLNSKYLDGSDVATISFPKGTLLKLELSPGGDLFSLQHTPSGSGKIERYSPNLALAGSITSDPEIPGSGFSNVSSFCTDASGRMFVSTRYNAGGVITDYSTSVFTLPSTRIGYWAQQNITGGNVVFAVTEDRMYVADGTDIYVRKEGSYQTLTTLRASLPKDPATTAAAVQDAKLGGNGKIYILVSGGILVCQRAYRTIWEGTGSTPPVPAVVNVAQRYGTSLLDIDYKVVDPDSSSLTTAAVAFQDGTQSLDKLVRMNTLVEGTGSNVGAGKTTNATYRLTWDAAADFSTNFVNLAVTVLAKDDRDLLGLHFLTIPASGGDPELTINRSPVTQAELMPSWYWLTARNDLTGAVFSNSAVYATTWLPPVSVTNGTAGISATYFNEVTWTGTSVSRIESQINYPTGTTWLPVGIDNTTFTVSWRAKFVAQATEALTFYTSTDDGAMLYIDGATIISKWSSQGMAESSGSINVTAGRSYDLQFDCYQNTGTYGAILRWSSPSIPKQIVPANRLFQSAPPLAPPYLLATGTHTTAAGRAYLWERLGVREATATEILRVKEAGHAGTISRYDPRMKVGAHPEKVNEYGFDTGTAWPADSYFLVPLAP